MYVFYFFVTSHIIFTDSYTCSFNCALHNSKIIGYILNILRRHIGFLTQKSQHFGLSFPIIFNHCSTILGCNYDVEKWPGQIATLKSNFSTALKFYITLFRNRTKQWHVCVMFCQLIAHSWPFNDCLISYNS